MQMWLCHKIYDTIDVNFFLILISEVEWKN